MYKLLICLFLFSCKHSPGAAIDTGKKFHHPSVAFTNMLGVNAFEWNFLQDAKNPNDGSHIIEPKMELIKTFSGVRHYLDWEKIEPAKGNFTFNPTQNGGWNLDAVYERCKTDNIDVLVCLKTCPPWLLETYPLNERDNENVPAPYGLNRLAPASYIEQAKAGFQFAARYGANLKVDKALVKVNNKPRWTGDQVNTVKIGMGLIKFIECDNERDKWWKGDKAHQTAAEYAANLSAFYDGDKGKMGKGVGVKLADPKMQVVMAGLADPSVKYVLDMIAWCKEHRGFRPDGSVNLCWDVINFHLYSNDHLQNAGSTGTVGVAPEISEAGKVADSFVQVGEKYKMPVWVTEAGYDVNAQSPQRAISIGNKPALTTQADWILRTALLYARHGIQKVFFYELYDDNLEKSTQYASSGLVTNDLKRRPAANYILQVKGLLGHYKYLETICDDPLVDVYRYKRNKVYVLTVPGEKDRSMNYKLLINNSNYATAYYPDPESVNMKESKFAITGKTLNIKVTETPVFIEVPGR